MNIVDIKILDPRIGKEFPLPFYSTDGSSAMDLCICVASEFSLKSNRTILLPTGIAIFINDPTITAMIIPRSGLGHKKGIILGNSVGLIDSDYQGELMVSVWNRSFNTFIVKPGIRIAQIVFLPILKIKFNIVSNFPDVTKRHNKGFGHSGY